MLKVGNEVYVVQQTATYTETNNKHTKDRGYVATELVLFSLKTGEIRFIEWAKDDFLEISFTERKLKRTELQGSLCDDEGAPFDIDEDIDECAENEWGLRLNGDLYPYDDDWACRFVSSDGREHEAHLYEFGSDEVGWLTIEAWRDGKGWEYEVYLSNPVPERAIEIVSLGRKAAS